MIPLINFVVGFLILVFALIDWKYRQIPSIFLTGALFVITAVNFSNIQFGILSFILAYLLLEADFIRGIADLKVIILIGLCITSIYGFFAYVGLIMGLGIGIKSYIYYKNPKIEEMAFIPVLFLVYLVLLIIQMLGGVI